MNIQKFILIDETFVNVANITTMKVLFNTNDYYNLLKIRINTVEQNNDKPYTFSFVNKMKYHLEKIDREMVIKIKEQFNIEFLTFLEGDNIVFNVEQVIDSIIERLSIVKKDSDKSE
jgi:hypothetical protein